MPCGYFCFSGVLQSWSCIMFRVFWFSVGDGAGFWVVLMFLLWCCWFVVALCVRRFHLFLNFMKRVTNLSQSSWSRKVRMKIPLWVHHNFRPVYFLAGTITSVAYTFLALMHASMCPRWNGIDLCYAEWLDISAISSTSTRRSRPIAMQRALTCLRHE